MLYKTVAEYDSAISDTQEAISRVIQTGVTRTIGDSKSTQEAQLQTLRGHLQLLWRDRDILTGADTSGGRIQLGW